MSNKLLAITGEFDPNESPEIIGQTFNYTPNGEDVFPVTMRRAGGQNDDFNKAWEKVTRTFRRSGVDIATLSPKRQRELTIPLYAEHVVLTWDQEAWGVPYSTENFAEVCKKAPAFLDWVIRMATEQNNFIARTREADAGN